VSFRLYLAGPEDEAEIRHLLKTNPLPGRVSVTYEREPDYFLGCRTLGRSCQVVVASDGRSGELAAVVCRATRPAWVNGEVEEVGYLNGARVAGRFRGCWLVPRSLKYLGDLDADSQVSGHLAAITEGSREARAILVEKARPGLPRFREAGRMYTAAISVRAPLFDQTSPPWLRRATPEDLPRIVAFLNEHGRGRQFSPFYGEEDFLPSTTPGFAVEDYMLAERDGEIRGVIGLWDQSDCKQTVVRGYSGALRYARPLYNAGARLTRRHPLPAPGESLSFAYASFVRVAGDDRTVFRALLRSVHGLAAKRGYAYLVAGLAEGDPLLPEIRRYSHVPYRSRLYTVTWPGGEGFHEKLDGRAPHVEISCL